MAKKKKKTMCDFCKKKEAQVFCVGDTTEEQKDKDLKLCEICFELNYFTYQGRMKI